MDHVNKMLNIVKFRFFTNVLQSHEVQPKSPHFPKKSPPFASRMSILELKTPTRTPRTHHRAKCSTFMPAGPLELLTNFTQQGDNIILQRTQSITSAAITQDGLASSSSSLNQ